MGGGAGGVGGSGGTGAAGGGAAADIPLDKPVDAPAEVKTDGPVDPPADPKPPADKPPDLPVDPPMCGPDAAPDAPSTSTGCADGTREGFLDPTAFPTMAACGNSGGGGFFWSTASMGIGAVCASGWHWCKPAEIAVLDGAPGPSGGSTCAWVDRLGAGCLDTVNSFSSTDCAPPKVQTAHTSATSGGPCPDMPDCASMWKVAADFANWAFTAITETTCEPHLNLLCGSDKSCFVACCKS